MARFQTTLGVSGGTAAGIGGGQGTNPVGTQAGTIPIQQQGGLQLDNPRILWLWLGAVLVLFVFHVGGARLP